MVSSHQLLEDYLLKKYLCNEFCAKFVRKVYVQKYHYILITHSVYFSWVIKKVENF